LLTTFTERLAGSLGLMILKPLYDASEMKFSMLFVSSLICVRYCVRCSGVMAPSATFTVSSFSLTSAVDTFSSPARETSSRPFTPPSCWLAEVVAAMSPRMRSATAKAAPSSRPSATRRPVEIRFWIVESSSVVLFSD
jgi:hypothetical protein